MIHNELNEQQMQELFCLTQLSTWIINVDGFLWFIDWKDLNMWSYKILTKMFVPVFQWGKKR